MKKVLCAILACLVVLSCFAGCTGNKEPETTTAKNAENVNTTAGNTGDKVYTVGICQLVQHEALDAATEGFKAALKDKLGDKVKFDEQNGSGDKPTCVTICTNFVSSGVDLIMANATDALAAASQATDKIPVVGTSITEYGVALGIENFSGKTGFNVTGTSDLAPLDKQADMVKELCPDAKTIGILYCSNEANSKYQADVVKDALEKLGYTVKAYTFVDTTDVSSVTQQMASEVDAVYIPTDNTAASNGEAINNILEPAKIPVIAGEEGICKRCGIATLSIKYYDIGYAAGEMAYEILVNGANPADMEIGYAAQSTKKYDADRCAALDIKIPEGYEALA